MTGQDAMTGGVSPRNNEWSKSDADRKILLGRCKQIPKTRYRECCGGRAFARGRHRPFGKADTGHADDRTVRRRLMHLDEQSRGVWLGKLLTACYWWLCNRASL